MAAPQVAVLGLGAMGSGMAHRLLEAGFDVTVHNRTAAACAPLVAAGATAATSAARAAAEAGTVLVSLSDEAAVDAVVVGELCRAMVPGTLVLDTSTVSPGHSRQTQDAVEVAGGRRLEACVLGNPHQARAGQLRIFAGGSEADVLAGKPVLDAIGSQLTHFGPTGAGTTMKLTMNLLLGAQVVALAEAVSFAVAGGLDRDETLAAIGDSGFSSKVMSFRAEIMRARRYDPPAFRARLMAKDLRLALTGSAEAGVDLPMLARAAQSFFDVVDAGQGDLDAAILLEHQLGLSPAAAP